MKDKILSIQSKVVYGYVGGNIADLVIQLQGLDVISFPTVLLSAHTQYKPIHGKAFERAWFDDLVQGICTHGFIDDAACFMSGYIGSDDILEASASLIAQLKQQYPDIPYICDPVMGDIDTGLYVPKAVADKLVETLVPSSNIITPNLFELEYITQKKLTSAEEVEQAVGQDPLLKQKTVVVTSCGFKDTPPDKTETLIVEGATTQRVYSPKIAISTTGTGDLFTALLATQLVFGKDIQQAVKKASCTISDILAYMLQKGHTEINADSLTRFIGRKD